jgi:hypothetical protein
MKIFNRYTGKIIFEFECETIKECVTKAVKLGVSLSGAYLSEVSLGGAYLSGADLRRADLSGADLSGANLSGADLSGADLRRADLRDANLSGANLSGASLSGADLSGANLWDANLNGAKEIVRFSFYGYELIVQLNKTTIGCKEYTNEEWLSMDFETAKKLGCKTLQEHYAYKKFITLGVSILKEQQQILGE